MLDKRKKNSFAGALLLIGLGLIASPWAFGFSHAPVAATSAGVLGLAFALLAFAAYVELIDWAARGTMGVGAWSMLAPLVIGFHGDEAALTTHLAISAIGIVAAVGGHELLNRNPPHHRA